MRKVFEWIEESCQRKWAVFIDDDCEEPYCLVAYETTDWDGRVHWEEPDTLGFIGTQVLRKAVCALAE